MQTGSLPYSGYAQASEHGRIRLYQWDCMELLKQTPDNYYGLCIVDPPYGLNKKISAGGGPSSKSTVNFHNKYNLKKWDSAAPGPDYFDELRRVSRNQIIWGGNYFALPPTRGFAFWYKHTPVPNFSAGEFAWTSFDCPAKCFDYMYTNIIDGNKHRVMVDHPTAKPVALYQWLLRNYAKPGQRILDTHGGSMSIAIACDIEGYDLTLCEIDADYFKAGSKRLRDHQSAPRLFAPEPAKVSEQMSIDIPE